MAEVAGVIAARAGEVSAIVIEDYGKGAVTQQTVDACAEAAGRYGIELGLDPKDNHELRIGGMTTATPNYREACAAAGVRERQLDALPDPAAHLQDVAQRLLDRWGARFVVITLGAHGMFVTGRGRPPLMIPTRAREVFDVSGAGDTVIATVMLALAAGASEAEAASLSNYAAGVVVGKLGTATCTPGELLGFMDAVRAAPSPPSTA
jgi:D-beta-D-heptose 7-phosphate kinase/D-beta-D-heptose 1-phosphate adenosyltransferase